MYKLVVSFQKSSFKNRGSIKGYFLAGEFGSAFKLQNRFDTT